MKNIQLYIFLLLFPYALCICQEPAQIHAETKLVVITILDGTEIIGIIQKETESPFNSVLEHICITLAGNDMLISLGLVLLAIFLIKTIVVIWINFRWYR